MTSDPISLPTDPTQLNAQQRRRDLAAVGQGTFDVLVIGAGVTGAGAALDAAARGLSVVLVEAGDIAVGTSSRSGKTFHGGLRYLQQLNFNLVRHAIAERDLMVKTICPHLAKPEPFMYPLQKHWERPYAGAGIMLYDIFGLKGKGVPRHKHFTRRGVIKQAPAFDPAVITGGIQYFDVRMDDARHTLAVARTAAGFGAKILVRAAVVGFLKEGVRVVGATIKDTLTGETHDIKARSVINASGVWSADLQQLAGANTFSIQPAKGIHLLLRKDAIDSETGLLAPATDSVIIARKWWDYWLVGTTDTPWEGDANTPIADRDDVQYLLRELNHFLKKKITADDVLGVFAGLRPLLKPVNDDKGATSAISRDHSVIQGPAGFVTIVGGKYTTYRRMAADAVKGAVEAAALAGHPINAGGTVPASPTATLPLIGAAGWSALQNRIPALAGETGLSTHQVERLLTRYGDRINEVLALAHQPADTQPNPDWAGYLPVELIYAVQSEGAVTLGDVLIRRTHLSIELSDGAHRAAPAIARLLAPITGWDEAEIDSQVTAFNTEIAGERSALESVRA